MQAPPFTVYRWERSLVCQVSPLLLGLELRNVLGGNRKSQAGSL